MVTRWGYVSLLPPAWSWQWHRDELPCPLCHQRRQRWHEDAATRPLWPRRHDEATSRGHVSPLSPRWPRRWRPSTAACPLCHRGVAGGPRVPSVPCHLPLPQPPLQVRYRSPLGGTQGWPRGGDGSVMSVPGGEAVPRVPARPPRGVVALGGGVRGHLGDNRDIGDSRDKGYVQVNVGDPGGVLVALRTLGTLGGGHCGVIGDTGGMLVALVALGTPGG